MVKTTSGEEITWKEAWRRFKQGLDNITPIQKLKTETRGTLITLIGFIVSLIAVIYNFESLGLISYGLILIFLGSIITTRLKYLGLRTQLKQFEQYEYIELELNKKEEQCLKKQPRKLDFGY